MKDFAIASIPKHPGYEATSDGRILSRWTRTGGRGGLVIGECRRELSGAIDKDGYRKVILCDGLGNRSYKRVHVLILESFSGPCPIGMVGVHCDGSRTNNSIDNLRWDTQKENIRDKRRHGTHQCGSKHGCAILTESLVKEIRSQRNRGVSLKRLTDSFGVSYHTICAVVYRYSWKHVE